MPPTQGLLRCGLVLFSADAKAREAPVKFACAAGTGRARDHARDPSQGKTAPGSRVTQEMRSPGR